MFNQNMGAVPGYGDALPTGCYTFRVTKIDIVDGASFVMFVKCQDEPLVGRSVRENFDLTSDISLQKLKSYYKACGYEPGPEGHDPNQIQDGEFTAVVVHNKGKDGNTYANIAPWSIRSVMENPAQPLGVK